MFQSDKYSLRPIENSDAEQVWIWINDKEVRANSFYPQVISWEEHCRWWKNQIVSPNWKAYMGMDCKSRPIGIVRFDIQETVAQIGIAIAAEARGQGWAKKIIAQGSTLIFSETSINLISALIKPENIFSIKAFCSAGFHETDNLIDFPFAHRHFILLRPN